MTNAGRSNKVILIIGQAEVGKTTLVLSIINGQVKKVCIYDVNNEEKYQGFPLMEIADIPRWKAGKYRVFTDEEDELFNMLYDKRYGVNMMAVFEEATGYLINIVPKTIRKLVTSRRHRNMDLVFIFHSIADIPPFLLRMSNFITFFKTEDSIDNLLSIKKLPNKAKAIETWERVKNHPSQFYYETVKTGA
jgi:nucleoside-triphosphatase THEP1